MSNSCRYWFPDSFTDKFSPKIQEALLQDFSDMIYAVAADTNGYLPTHNKRFSKPMTGNSEIDVINNRTKRIYDDATCIRCSQHTDKFLLQTYKRDTGKICMTFLRQLLFKVSTGAASKLVLKPKMKSQL